MKLRFSLISGEFLTNSGVVNGMRLDETQSIKNYFPRSV